jgi:hypothetical protein
VKSLARLDRPALLAHVAERHRRAGRVLGFKRANRPLV